MYKEILQRASMRVRIFLTYLLVATSTIVSVVAAPSASAATACTSSQVTTTLTASTTTPLTGASNTLIATVSKNSGQTCSLGTSTSYYAYFYYNATNTTLISGATQITCTAPSSTKVYSTSSGTTFTCGVTSASSVVTRYYFVRYKPSSGYSTSATKAITTQGGVSTTSLSTGLSPQTTTVGTPVTLTATVTTGATGTVTFAAGGSSSTLSNCGTSGAVTISGSTASCTWTPTGASSGVSITASYGGNGSYGTSSASPISVPVTQRSTSIAFNSPPSSSAKNTPNNLSATVTPAGAVGTVTFKQTVNGTETSITGCSTKAITSGTATCAWTTDNLTETATINAYFLPTTAANYASSNTSGVDVSVGAFTGTTTTLAADVGSSPKTITLGSSIVFTATASRASGNVAFSNTSYFEFYYGNTKITSCGSAGQVTISGSSAICTWTPLTAITGGINVTAVYSGDSSTFTQSTSSAYTVTVSKANTTTVLTKSAGSSVNTPITLTATVSRTTGTAALDAAGYVIFKVGGTAITNTTSTCGDSAGHVLIDVSTNATSCIWTPIAISSGVLTATYYNDANYNDSPASPSVALTVGKGTGTLVIASSDADTSLTAPSPVTLTATLTNIPADLAGTITFQLPGSDTCASGFDGAITGPGSITCDWSPGSSNLSGASITATFTPTSGTNWNTTTASATSVIVHAVPVVSGSATIGATTGTAKTTSAYTVADSSNGLTITWSLTSAPAGVSIDAATGVISISASPTGGSFSVIATDSNSVASIGKSVTLTVSNLLAITTPTGSGLNGNATSTFGTLTVGSSGGAGTNVFSLASDSSALPSGLTLNSSGTITGTPTTAGSYTGIKVKVTDANGATATTSAFTLTIASAVAIVSPSGSNAASVGTSFTLTVTSTGGAGSNSYTLATGSATLPAGLNLSSDGMISGTPTTAGTTAGIKVTVTDALSATSTTSLFAIVVAKATLSTPTSVSASATSGSTTSITVTFSGDSHATSFTAKVYLAGTLTKTVTSFTSTSAITGLTAATAYTVGITAIGGSNYSDSSESSRGSVTTGSTSMSPTIDTQPTGASRTAGQAIKLIVSASSNDSGDLTYQWRKGGSNISGATDSTLVITSLVTGDAGTYTVVVTNTKSGTTATATSTGALVTVSTALSITTPTGSGISSSYLSTYSLTISASGGSGTKTFALTSGTLPAWASLSSSGVITGTPNAVAVTSGLLVTVTDANSAMAATSSFSITIGKADPVIAWDTPSPIRFGAHLTSTEMDATASFGGSALAGGFVYTPDASTTLSSGTVSLSAVFTPTDGTHYNTITTANSVVVLSATGPNAPAKPTLTATGAAAGSLILTWSRITGSPENGGSAVTGYQYRVQRTDSESWGDWSSTQAESATTATISGLTKNKAYIVQVRAVNAVHEGSVSISSTSATVAGVAVAVPSAPRNVAVTTEDGKLFISFDTPSGSSEGDEGDSDAKITAYQYSLDGGSTWKSTGSTSHPITVTSLVNGTTYDVRVRALNSVGTGTASTTFTGSAKPNKAPDKPTIVSIAVGTGALTASFNPPADTGGGTLTYSYRLQTSNDGDSWGDWKSTGTLTATNTGFSYVISGVNNGSTYHLQMKSTNEFDRSSGVTSTFEKSSSKASKPTITSQPVAQSLTATQTSAFTLSVTATTGSGETLSYQWYKTSSAIDGATSATYAIARALLVGDAGDYYVIVSSTINGTSDTRQSSTVHQNVAAKLTVSATAPGATANSDYSKVLSVTDGAAPFTWVGTGVPTGLTLDSNGTLHGKVTTANTYTFSATATDKNGVSNTATVSLLVSPALLIVTTSLDATSVDKSYSDVLTASGGNSSSYTWAVTGDVSLPSGLTLSSGGTIAGTTGHTATSKTFSITVTDANGATLTSKFTIAVVSGVAGAPTLNATITKPASGQLAISWTAPSDIGGSSITEYAIKYVSSSSGDSEDKGTKTVKVSDLGGSPFSATISELKNGREYTISISAKNSGGYGTSSLSYTATPGVTPGKPQSVTTTLDGAGMVLRWKKPDGEGYGDLTYSAQCKKDSDAYTTVVITGSSSEDEGRMSKTITGLTAGSHYICQVKSTSTYGSSEWSTATSDLTYMAKPGTPQSISGSSSGDGNVTVSWQAPASNGGGQITSYIASSNKNGGEDNEGNRSCSIARASASDAANWDDAGYTFTCKIAGMPKKGSFKVYLVAVNAVGTSAKSSGTDVTIEGKAQTLTLPLAARSTINKKVGDADFSIGATVDSGLKVGYTSNNPTSCLVTSARMIRPLAAGDCVITVTQNGKKDDNNDGEDSEYGQISGSNTVNVHVTAATPGAPIITGVVVGDATITVTWKPNTGVGSAPTGYNFQYGDTATSVTWSASTPITDATSSITYALSSLTNGTGYEVRVQAVNGALISDWIVAAGPYIPAGVPSAPAAPTVTMSDSNGSASISWSAPSSNGGSPIKGYKVTSTRTGSTATCTTGIVSLTCNIGGLANKFGYSFTVQAQNSSVTNGGWGAASSATTGTLNGLAQAIIFDTSTAIIGWTVGDADVQLKAKTDSGLAITFGSTDSSICSVSSSGSVHFKTSGNCQITMDQLGTGTNYSAATQVRALLVIDPATPSAPLITSVTNVTTGLTVVWSAPSRLGGALTYVVTAVPTMDSSTAVTCAPVAPAMTCTLLGDGGTLVKGTEYSITVVAHNAAGDGPASGARIGKWQTKPTVPNSATAVKDSTDGRAINVTWAKSTDDGTSSILRYVATATPTDGSLSAKTCQVTPSGALDTSGYTCAITALRAGATYNIAIVAVNAIGTSPSAAVNGIVPGLTQTITVTTPIPKVLGASDFALDASSTSGKPLTYTTSDSTCTLPSAGVVHVVSVGICTIHINQSGSTSSDEFGYAPAAQVDAVINITATTPDAPAIIKAVPGVGKITVTWTAPTFTGGATTTTTARAYLAGTAVGSCTTSPCEITTGLVNGTTYTVKVEAQNSVGSTFSSSLTARPYDALPNAPVPLVAQGGLAQVDLSWTAPSNVDALGVGHSIHHYQVEGRIAPANPADAWPGTPALSYNPVDTNTATTTSFAGLAPGTSYEFRVRAVGVDGGTTTYSEYTGSSYANTFGVPVFTGATLSLTPGFSAGHATITVSWPVPSSNGGTSVTGFTATATNGGTSTSCSGAANATTCTILALTSGLPYSVSLVATNAVGNSLPLTGSVTTVGAPTVAPVITGVTSSVDTGTATISWTGIPASGNGGKVVTSYTVNAYKDGSGTSSASCSAVSTDTDSTPGSYSCTITGLTYKSDYVFKAVATNIAGDGLASAATTPAVNLVLVQSISFANPYSSGVVNFTVGSVVLSATSTSGGAISFTTVSSACSVSASTVTFLGLGTCAIVANQNGAGTNYAAADPVPQTFTIQAIAPESVSLLQVEPGASTLKATWSIITVAQLGGSAFKHYVISWAKNSNFSDETTAIVSTRTTDNYQIPGLDALATYRVRVQVITEDWADGSAWSNVLTGTTFGLPSAPTIEPTPTSPAPGSATITWADSTNDGGTPITGYVAKAYDATSDALTGQTCASSTQTCVISGLSGAVSYKFRVFASNAVGSTSSGLTTTALRPGSSQALTVANVSKLHTDANFAADASSSSGLPVQFSKVSGSDSLSDTYNATPWASGRAVCSMDSATGAVTIDLAGTCTIAADQNGYDAVVGGNSTTYLAAPQKTFTVTVAATLPGVIRVPSATSDNAKLRIQWSAPTAGADGGVHITGYQITWWNQTDHAWNVGGAMARPSDADFAAFSVSDTSSWYNFGRMMVNAANWYDFYLENLHNGDTYTILIQAQNSVGLGPESL